MELPTLEQTIAEVRAAAAQRRAEAAIPQVDHVGGAGGPGIGSMLEQGADEFGESPVGKAVNAVRGAVSGTTQWVKNLPKNLSLGTLDASVNSVNGTFDLAEAGVKEAPAAAVAASPGMAMIGAAGLAFDRSGITSAYDQWRASLREDDSLADSLTQGVAQFTVPFMAWARGFGMSSKLGVTANFLRGLGAEAVTTGTAFSPTDGRVADLVDLGRHSEGRFGEVLNQLSPDGSAANAYINWMVDRSTEGHGEARFKNTIDGLVPSVALAGLLKAAGTSFRVARTLPEKFEQNVLNAAPVGKRKAQRGQLTLSLDSQPREVPLGNVTDTHTDSVLDGEFVVPGSQVLTSKVDGKPAGFIAFKEEGGVLQINRVKVADDLRGKGIGKQLLLQALDQAETQGKKLVSDNTVTAAQLHVYESLSRDGKIRITYSDPEAVKTALAAKDARIPVKGKGGQPVVTSIERIRPIKE